MREGNRGPKAGGRGLVVKRCPVVVSLPRFKDKLSHLPVL